MKLFIKTYGCQANISDSEHLAGLLVQKGHKLVKKEKDADVIIINSCSVKNATQSSVLDYIQKNNQKQIFVGGCLTKTLDLRKKFPDLAGIFDTNSINKINSIITSKKDAFSDKKENHLNLPVIRNKKNIAIITISEGCMNKCTFCATKLARGNLKSYRIGDIKRALEKAVKEKCSLIYLTSQDTGCYGFDIKTSLPELLDELVKVPGNYKIRVGMMNPWHLKKIINPLLRSFESEKIMKFLHIPVQSGSEKVLKDMRRIHTVGDFKQQVKLFRKKFSDFNISTDIIVGYPTETGQDFKKTYNLIKELKPEVLNISRFSSRPKTFASKLEQIPSEIMKERSRKLAILYNSYRKASNKIKA